ncbi:CDP-alcohol phosphatidyltransferase family protein, partial [Streptomyces brasiliscabiei]|uniref:CDP-alcohol phosphatidyltransferase family protein n=1 Tax=Streptomyces brasiliscabiei TaxID=2736302 RepID=UPI003014C673
MIIGDYKLANLITYLGLALSLTSMVLILQNKLELAMIAFILSGICDLFDGSFANSFQRTDAEKSFGIELDSLCDVINFAALPAFL